MIKGCGRDGDKEFSRFIDIAQGSAYEVRCQVFVARDLGYITVEKFELLDTKITEISRMLNSLNQKLKVNHCGLGLCPSRANGEPVGLRAKS